MKKIISALLLASFINADGLYNSDFMRKSGILHESIETGIPNYVNGSKLLHWHGYISDTIHIVFYNNEVANPDVFDYLANIIRLNKNRIKYITLTGYSSLIVNEENRIALRPWSSVWHSISGENRLQKYQAISLVNNRLQYMYDFLRDEGVSAHKIYNENRLDREPISTEATKEGRLLNNRVDVRIYSYRPLLKDNSCYIK